MNYNAKNKKTKNKSKNKKNTKNRDNNNKSASNNSNNYSDKSNINNINKSKLFIDNNSNVEIIDNRYELYKDILLGKGAFGLIYLAKDSLNNNQVAIKIDRNINTVNQLSKEKYVIDSIYENLNNNDIKHVGISKIYDIGKHQDANYIVMDVLGPNLFQIFKYCNYHFSLQTILLISIQCIDLIEILHSNKFIHKDIKPENFLIGNNNLTNKLYLIDFGLSSKYVDSCNDHIKYKENNSLVGTARYASINNHMGIEQSRRDDLESLGYMIIYFCKKGNLPWKGIKDSNNILKYKKILKKKILTSVEMLCLDMPSKLK